MLTVQDNQSSTIKENKKAKLDNPMAIISPVISHIEPIYSMTQINKKHFDHVILYSEIYSCGLIMGRHLVNKNE